MPQKKNDEDLAALQRFMMMSGIGGSGAALGEAAAKKAFSKPSFSVIQPGQLERLEAITQQKTAKPLVKFMMQTNPKARILGMLLGGGLGAAAGYGLTREAE